MSLEHSPRRARYMIRGWNGITAYTGYGRTQLQEMIKRGEFEPPMKIGPRRVGWFEDVVRAWQDRLAASRERT